LAVPGILLVRELIDESTSGIAALRNTVDLSTWRHAAESNRFLQPLLAALGRLDVEVNDVGREIANRLGGWLTPAFTRSVWVLSQLATFLFAFFFFVKDQESMIEAIQSRLPFNKRRLKLPFRKNYRCDPRSSVRPRSDRVAARIPRRNDLSIRRITSTVILGCSDGGPLYAPGGGCLPDMGSCGRLSIDPRALGALAGGGRLGNDRDSPRG
jgi:hypothetical protein